MKVVQVMLLTPNENNKGQEKQEESLRHFFVGGNFLRMPLNFELQP